MASVREQSRPAVGTWLALVGITAVMATAAGGRFLVGLVFPDIQHDLGLSHGELGSVVSLSVLIVGFAQPLVGWLVDSLSARVVALGGLTCLGIGLLLGSRATGLGGLTVGLGVLAGIGLATVSPTLLTPVVASWFERGRTTALSVTATANPAGQALVVPALAILVAALGWRGAFASLGVALLLLGPLAFLLLRDRGSKRRAVSDAVGCGVREALATGAWWQFAFGFFVCGFTMGWVMTFFVDYATRLGIGHTVAATGLSLTGWASIVGAFATGWWLDRSGSSVPLATVYALRGLGFVLLLLIGSTPLGLLAAALVIGVSWSATTPLTSSLCTTLFGRRRLGTIFGILFAVMPIGTAAGSALGGLLFDATGSYFWSLVVSAVAGFAAALAVAPVRVSARPCAVAAHSSGSVVSVAG
ncbi:MAG: MFS transporter [Thermomicrobium sp.]|nr:MFS transporter [Thermomicrobium sp.]MDW8058643.1 MFS transporter [Thermomicrobium sp.]